MAPSAAAQTGAHCITTGLQHPAATAVCSSSNPWRSTWRSRITAARDSSGSGNAAVGTLTSAAKAGQSPLQQQGQQQQQGLSGPGSLEDLQQQQQQQHVQLSLQEHQQEVKGLKQLVLQQQALITALQQDMQELKTTLGQQQQQQLQQLPQLQQADSSSSSSSSPGASEATPSSWQQQQQQQRPITVRIPTSPPPPPPLPQQQEQQQQQQQQGTGVLHGSYQAMSVEVFQSLPDKIILVRHAESLGNVDATTYSSTPDYEVRPNLWWGGGGGEGGGVERGMRAVEG